MPVAREASTCRLPIDAGGDGAGPGDEDADARGDLDGDTADATEPGPDGGDLGADSGADQGADGAEDGADAGPAVGPRVVFRLADENAPMSQNLLANPDLESVSGNAFTGWNGYRGGYQAGIGEGRSGNSIRLVRPAGDTAQYGAYQSIQLRRSEAWPLFFSGWSRSEGLSGEPDSSASIYLDIQYMTTADDPDHGCDPAPSSPCALYGQVPSPPFDTLPVLVPGGWWGQDARRRQPLSDAREFSNTATFWYDRLGATGYFSVYHLATVYADGWGIVLGVPLDQPRIFRLVYHPLTHQLYLACDLGLTPATAKFPNRAWMDLALYRTRPAEEKASRCI